MLHYFLIFIAIVLIIGFMMKWPSPGFYVYKTACFLLLLPALVLALFFTLASYPHTLTVHLHPWREYVRWRFLFATVVTAVMFIISQLPLPFMPGLRNRGKIVKIEAIIYLSFLAFGTILCYFAIQGDTHPENQIVRQIEAFHKTTGRYPDSIEDTGLQPDSIFPSGNIQVRYSHNDDAYTLLIGYEYNKILYDSRAEAWTEVDGDEQATDRLIVTPLDRDDIVFSDFERVASYGISNKEFFRLSQSQYEKARDLLLRHFNDSIRPQSGGEYLIEHPGGRLEYTAYPYGNYRRQFFGWKDSEGVPHAYVILISKELIKHDMETGFLDHDRDLIWIDDGGSNEVDVLINLDENKIELFAVHQHG